ncbi:MAG TPA: GDSL-type esterase/lipase family protein [Longimicrobiaceae bacterium]|nr:GDSL-type esterase/lipase family protein [Longimicrobiaceae bacterium]
MNRLACAALALVLAAGCARAADGDRGGGMRFLALGDSYTIGEAVDPAERWPVRLAALLRERGVDVAEPEIVARTGWTTDELSAAIDAADPRGPYALVSLLVGVNNQYRGRSAVEYREHFRALLARAAGFAGGEGGRVLVLSIPDWGVTPFAAGRDRARIAEEIDAFNRIAREEAERAGARWVDVTPQSRQAGADPSLVAVDGLHPSGESYEEWAWLALPAALAALGKPAA